MVINFNVWVGGHFLVSSLDSRCSSDNISGIFTHELSTTYWQMMVIHFNDPPAHPSRCFANYIFKTWARHNQLLPILFCRKKLKAQCKEQAVPVQFILHPVTFNFHKEYYYA